MAPMSISQTGVIPERDHIETNNTFVAILQTDL